MKKLSLLLVVLLNSLLVFGNESISVGILNGPSAIPAGYMIENVSKINDADLSVEKYANPQALLPKLIKKEVDIGFLPVNVAAKVYNSSKGAVICCGITGNGNISLVTKDKTVKSLSDLSGKKVNVAGQGATPDYLFKYILSSNGVDGVDMDFSIPTNQLAAMLVSGKIEYAVVPEPFVSVAQMKSKDITAAFNFQDEYRKITGSDKDYPLTVIVVTKEFAENNSDLLKAFLKEYEKSVTWTIENPAAAGKLSEKHNLGFKQPVAMKAIPNSNYCFVEAANGVKEIENFLNLFLNYAPESIGGKLPDEGFYFK